jgi:hypothetical protein
VLLDGWRQEGTPAPRVLERIRRAQAAVTPEGATAEARR